MELLRYLRVKWYLCESLESVSGKMYNDRYHVQYYEYNPGSFLATISLANRYLPESENAYFAASGAYEVLTILTN